MEVTARAALSAGTAMNTVQRAAAGAAQGYKTVTLSTNQTAAATSSLSATYSAIVGKMGNALQALRSYNTALAATPPAAAKASSALDRLGAAANDNINKMQATPGNIAAQFQDIGVSAAGGLNPMLIALQQGTQLSAAMSGGLGNLAKGFAQVLSPVNLLTIGLVGLAAAGLQMINWTQLAQDALNGLANVIVDISPYLAALAAGLILVNAPVIVSGVVALTSAYFKLATAIAAAALTPMGLVVALGIVVAAAIKFRDELTKIFGVDIVQAAADGINWIIGGFVGAYNGIVAAWDYLPGAFADIGIRAANALLGALHTAVVKTVDMLNPLSPLLKMGGLNLGGMIPDFKIDNPYAGMEKSVNTIVNANIKIAQQTDYIGNGIKAVKGLASDVAEQFREWAKQIGVTDETLKKVKDKAGKEGVDKALQEFERLVKASTDYAEALELEAKQIGKTTVELKRMAVAAQAALAPTDALRQRIIDAGKAWEQAFAGNELKKQNERIADLEREAEITQNIAQMRLDAYDKFGGDVLKEELRQIELAGEKARNIEAAAKEAAEYNRMAAGALEQGNEAAAKLWRDLAKGAERTAQLKNNALDAADNMRLAADQAQRFSESTNDALSALSQITGLNFEGFGDAFKDFKTKDGKAPFADMFKGVDKWLGDKLGSSFKQIGAGIAIGGMVDGIFDAIGVKSSKTGAQLGGAVGQFGGPLGAIAGSIIGGIVGGMMKSTPRASATIQVIAGEAMDASIKGSSGKLKAIAGQMADGVIAGLSELAASLGAQLTGDAKVSIGMRNGKYRVDPTGSGITKTSKGAIDFGEDKAAAIAFALQDAIKDGVLGGLSESLKRLITADGDLQTQLQKALSFKSVFDELAKKDDPAKFAQDEITRWRESMDKIFEEANATGEELAELERLTGIKRADAAAEAARALEEAARAELEKQRARTDLMIQIAELEGDATGALRMAREMEKASADASLGPLYDRIYALQDEASALERAAAARETFTQWATQQNSLTARLLELQGDATGALALTRENELMATDETFHSLLRRIYALEDEKTAADALAEAARIAAAEIEELARLQKAIDDERYRLETRLLEVNGDIVALRQRELATLDPSNRALQQLIWTREDEIAEAAKAAAALKAIADERYSLEDRYYNLIGDTMELRRRELAATLPENRAYLQMIFDTEDALARAAAAQEAYDAAVKEHEKLLNDAREALSQAYQRERGELEKTISTFQGFADSIYEFRRQLMGNLGTPTARTATAQGRYASTARGAAAGNSASLGRFITDANAYIDAAKGSSSTGQEFDLVMARVIADSDRAIKASEGQIDTAQHQIRLMEQQVEGILDLDESFMSFADALANYQEIAERQLPTIGQQIDVGLSNVADKLETVIQQTAGVDDNRKAEANSINGNLINLVDLWSRVIRGGRVMIGSDETISVNVANDNPIIVDAV